VTVLGSIFAEIKQLKGSCFGLFKVNDILFSTQKIVKIRLVRVNLSSSFEPDVALCMSYPVFPIMILTIVKMPK